MTYGCVDVEWRRCGASILVDKTDKSMTCPRWTKEPHTMVKGTSHEDRSYYEKYKESIKCGEL